SPDIAAVVGEARRHRARGRLVARFLDAATEGVVGVGHLHLHGTANGLLGPQQAVVVVVAVGPGVGAGALLHAGGFVVVDVTEGAVVQQTVTGAGLVAGGVALAHQVVAIDLRAGAGQLVGGVVAVAAADAIADLGL